jgi:hypothetical protein
MWLLTGRYAAFGPVICVIAVAAGAVGATFLIGAIRLIRKSDLGAVLMTAMGAVAYGYSSAYGEPTFVGNGALNRGAALSVAVLGVLLGVGGAILLSRLRLLRLLLLIAASGILFGDVAGWIRRTTGPSKYDQPIGQLLSPPGALTRQAGAVLSGNAV